MDKKHFCMTGVAVRTLHTVTTTSGSPNSLLTCNLNLSPSDKWRWGAGHTSNVPPLWLETEATQ